jgi:hypothetical protein
VFQASITSSTLSAFNTGTEKADETDSEAYGFRIYERDLIVRNCFVAGEGYCKQRVLKMR